MFIFIASKQKQKKIKLTDFHAARALIHGHMELRKGR